MTDQTEQARQGPPPCPPPPPQPPGAPEAPVSSHPAAREMADRSAAGSNRNKHAASSVSPPPLQARIAACFASSKQLDERLLQQQQRLRNCAELAARHNAISRQQQRG